jgi:hypothetical protein
VKSIKSIAALEGFAGNASLLQEAEDQLHSVEKMVNVGQMTGGGIHGYP